MNINKELAYEILSAIHIAQAETGDFYELEKKILKEFPEIVDERKQLQIELNKECEKQHTMRKNIVNRFYLDIAFPTVQNTVEWFIHNYDDVRANYSDEICFAGDLWQYLPKFQLKELIKSLRASKGRNSFEDDGLKNRKDDELWHSLIPFLEQATYLERVRKSKKKSV